MFTEILPFLPTGNALLLDGGGHRAEPLPAGGLHLGPLPQWATVGAADS